MGKMPDLDNEIHHDFDCCGMGDIHYDLAVYKWQMRWLKREDDMWPAFIEAYQAIHPFEVDEFKLELYVAVRDVWLVAIHLENADDFEHSWINDQYFDSHYNYLQRCIENLSG